MQNPGISDSEGEWASRVCPVADIWIAKLMSVERGGAESEQEPPTPWHNAFERVEVRGGGMRKSW